jgi:uncharacterized protein YbdZ (MbtH family)
MAHLDENQRYSTQVEAILAGRLTGVSIFYILKHSEDNYSLARVVEDIPAHSRARALIHAVCQKEADGSYTVRSWKALHPEDSKPEFRLPLGLYPLLTCDEDDFGENGNG